MTDEHRTTEGALARQRRGQRIAMSPSELDAFLEREHTCRVATIGPDGPHVSPLWFVWDGTSLWISSVIRSQRWANLERDPRVNVIVDTGTEYGELRGVQLTGTCAFVGEIPRCGEPNDDLRDVEARFARKYRHGDEFAYDGRHAWIRLVPSKIVSWDFHKIAPRS